VNTHKVFLAILKKRVAPCLLCITGLFGASFAVYANSVSLGSASPFTVLSASGAINCTNSTIEGDVGSAVAGTRTSCVQSGDVVTAVSQDIQAGFRDAYSTLAGEQCDYTLATLAGQVLEPGTYCVDNASTNTGSVLTLDGDEDDTWLFKIGTSGSGALTGTDFVVDMIGGAQACNVTWWVADAVTLTRGDFKGDILAGQAVTVTGVASNSPVKGRIMAEGTVVLTNADALGCYDSYDDNKNSKNVTIKQVTVNFGPSDTLTIVGHSFTRDIATGAIPVVTLGDNSSPLILINYSDDVIFAECPLDYNFTPRCIAGDYRLKVSSGTRSKSKNKTDSYDLTIGAVGPQGGVGELGPTGSQGVQGAQGIQGLRGDEGTQGLKGDLGLTGSQGAQGIAGINGTLGVDGMNGIDGAPGPVGPSGLERTDKLAECGGAFATGGAPRDFNPALVAISPAMAAMAISPATAGVFVDTDANSTWGYGYLDQQLYTDAEGNLKCGVVVDLQGLVENVLDVGFGAVCTYAGLAASIDKTQEPVDAACGITDNVVRTINALFWLSVSGRERAVELLDGGNPPVVKGLGAHAALYQSINQLTVGIPPGPAEFIALIKEQVIDIPIEALSRGVIKVGPVEINLSELRSPHEIVLDNFKTSGNLLLETPEEFVAQTAQELVEYYFDQIVNPELIQVIIDEASRLDFVDADGNQAFSIALNGVTDNGIDLKNGTGIGFNLNGTEMLSLTPTALGIDVDASAFDITGDSLSYQVNGTQIITAGADDVCLLGLCKSTISSFIDTLPVDLPAQLSALNNIPSDLTAQLNTLDKINDLLYVNTGFWSTWNDGGLFSRMNETTKVINNVLSPGVNNLKSELTTFKARVPSDLTDQLQALNDLDMGAFKAWATPWISNYHNLLYGPFGTGALGHDSFTMKELITNNREWVITLNSHVGNIYNRLAGGVLGPVTDCVTNPLSCLSDARLKFDVIPLTQSLDKVLQLQGVTHRWNEKVGEFGVTDMDRTELGFIAQDVAQVVPELVTEGSDGYFRLNYTKMAPLLVEGIKEQQAQIELLQQENNQLKTYLCTTDPAAPFCAN
jgi:hypothetical protein